MWIAAEKASLMARPSSSGVRASALRSEALILLHIVSIGLRSGEVSHEGCCVSGGNKGGQGFQEVTCLQAGFILRVKSRSAPLAMRSTDAPAKQPTCSAS